MKIEHLIKMANSIGSFFASESDRNVAIEEIRHHLSRTWEARMRRELIAYNQNDGAELTELVREAVLRLQAETKPS